MIQEKNSIILVKLRSQSEVPGILDPFWFQYQQAFKLSETITGGVLYKKMFLKISQNLQENTCARV